MEDVSATPGGILSDEEYKALVVRKYGHIRGLAKTLLLARRSNREDAGRPGKRVSLEDTANYRRIREETDLARRALNRLHFRLQYAEKNGSLGDVPYAEIRSTLEDVAGALARIERQYVEPGLERQGGEPGTDYADY